MNVAALTILLLSKRIKKVVNIRKLRAIWICSNLCKCHEQHTTIGTSWAPRGVVPFDGALLCHMDKTNIPCWQGQCLWPFQDVRFATGNYCNCLLFNCRDVACFAFHIFQQIHSSALYLQPHMWVQSVLQKRRSPLLCCGLSWLCPSCPHT